MNYVVVIRALVTMKLNTTFIGTILERIGDSSLIKIMQEPIIQFMSFCHSYFIMNF